jgi:hypothetical protein
MSQQIIYGGSGTLLDTAATEYIAVIGGRVLQSGTERALMPWSPPGVISNLRIWLSAAPGAGKSRTFTFDGHGGTSQSVAISGASDTTGEDTSNSTSVSAGDEVYITCTPAGTPAVAYMRYAYKFTPTTAGQTIVGCITEDTQLSTGTVEYLPMSGALGGAATAGSIAGVQVWVPIPGTISNTYVHLTTAPGAGRKDRVIQWQNNGNNMAVQKVQIADGATTGNDTTDSFSFVDNDYLNFRSGFAGRDALGPVASYVAVTATLTPDDPDCFLIMNTAEDYMPIGTNTEYRQCHTGGNVWNAAVTSVRFVAHPMLIDRARFKVTTAPAAGGLWSVGMDNISNEPNWTFLPGGAINVLAVAPKEVSGALDWAPFSQVVHAVNVAGPGMSTNRLSACYACKVPQVTQPPWLF